MRSNLTFTYRNWTFNFSFKGRITVVDGDTSTGKSLFCDSLARAVNNDPSGNLKKISVYNSLYKCDLAALQGRSNEFIVIDNADIILNDDIAEYIAEDLNNQYLIFARQPWDFRITPDNFAALINSNNEFSIEYFKVPGWEDV